MGSLKRGRGCPITGVRSILLTIFSPVPSRTGLFQFQCEQLFNLIYGTQIWLLDTLAISPPGGVTLIGAQPYYAEHQRRTGRTDYTLRQFLHFLVSRGALEVNPGPSGEIFRITDFGKGFLAYIKAAYPLHWSQRLY